MALCGLQQAKDAKQDTVKGRALSARGTLNLGSFLKKHLPPADFTVCPASGEQQAHIQVTMGAYDSAGQLSAKYTSYPQVYSVSIDDSSLVASFLECTDWDGFPMPFAPNLQCTATQKGRLLAWTSL